MGLDEAYADLTGVAKPLRVLRELIDGGQEADRDPDLGRRRADRGWWPSAARTSASPPGFVAMGREEACIRFAPGADAPAARASARRPPSAWPSSATRPSAQLQEADEAQLAARFGDRMAALPEGARRVPRRLAGGDRSPARPSRSRPSARSTPTSPPTTSSRRSCATLSRELCEGLQQQGPPRAARSRSRSASPTGRRSPARARSDGSTNDTALRHRDGARAAARLRAAAAGAAARRAPGELRRRRARQSRRRPVAPRRVSSRSSCGGRV